MLILSRKPQESWSWEAPSASRKCSKSRWPPENVMHPFNTDDQIVSLTRAPNPVQAHIWENALHVVGIHCEVVDDYFAAGIGDISGVQPEIWVKRHDVTQAQGVLQRCCSTARPETAGKEGGKRGLTSHEQD